MLPLVATFLTQDWVQDVAKFLPMNLATAMVAVTEADAERGVLELPEITAEVTPIPVVGDTPEIVFRLADGSEIDLLHPQRGAPDYGKPENYATEQENIRWLTYRGRLWQKQYAAHRRWYGKYLCRQWNAGHHGHERLMSFQMIYMLERTPPPGETPQVEQVVTWRQDCYPDPVRSAP